MGATASVSRAPTDDGAMSDDVDHPRTLPLILVSNRQSSPLDEAGLVSLAAETLRGEGAADTELSVSFVGDTEMEELHRRYLDEPGPTDVLSFPQDPAGLGDGTGDGESVLGDVVIAPSVAARNNPDDPGGELRLLVVHGVLHLLGYDHEEDGERATMWARQTAYSGVEAP
jgi:probable rRNA maturation factor